MSILQVLLFWAVLEVLLERVAADIAALTRCHAGVVLLAQCCDAVCCGQVRK